MESRKSERAQPVVVARHTGGPGAAGAESFTLPNGMQVIVREDHFAPVVALQAWVKVGAADEHDEEAGVAHVHEHMLFKGTARRGVGQIAAEVESSGGLINAFTTSEATFAGETVPASMFSFTPDWSFMSWYMPASLTKVGQITLALRPRLRNSARYDSVNAMRPALEAA